MTAQQVISTALDREPVDPYQLEEAKEHCRTCPDCGLFVRAQLVAKQVPLPAPPADLADRVMARVRAEAAEAADAAAAKATADATAAADSEAAAAARLPIATLAPKSRIARKLPWMWVSAAVAAAVLVALLGTGTIVILGLRQMEGSTASRTEVFRGAVTQKAPGVATDLGAPAATGAVEATSAQCITINGAVYRLSGPSTVDTAAAVIIGSTNSALGGTGSIQKRDVWAASSAADKVYLADDAGAQLSFTRVTREYAGLTFGLTSSELTSFSQWPVLPAQIQPPTSADGQPTFVYDGTDASSIRVYRLANSTATQGIAIAPNSPSSDPAGGDPNWTWWAILH